MLNVIDPAGGAGVGDLDGAVKRIYPLPPMIRSQLLAHGILITFAALCALGADEFSLKPREGVVLLTNGEIIRGTITSAGDRYDVVGKDSEIRVKRSEVAVVCPDLDGCYQFKRQAIEQGRTLDHLELAEWCIKHQLIAHAEQEIEAARASDPSHPRIRLLEPRLALAKEKPPSQPPDGGRARSASGEQLDGLVRNLPHGSVESFTNTIQPMLLNYCAKSGCHGPRGTAQFKLERITPNRLAGRHATQANLQAVLAVIDRSEVAASKVLTAPIRPHGSLKNPVFTDREQVQYKQLVQWVYLLAAEKKPTPAEPTLAERTAPLLQTVPRPGQAGRAMGKGSAKTAQVQAAEWSESFPNQKPGAKIRTAESPSGEPATERTMEPASAKNDSPDEFVPRDAFDPEIFNRRFFPR
ncbi:MAG TPA: hypothetical protein VGJ16_02275 [Pirellulales bacterium]